MAKSFKCRVVTPIASLLSEEVKHVQMPAWDGSMGFLPGRSPLVSRLGAGELRLEFADTSKGQGGSRSFFVDGGVAKMQGDELLILAEKAAAAESIVLADAEAELKAAMSPKQGTKAEDERRAQTSARAKVAFAQRARGGI